LDKTWGQGHRDQRLHRVASVAVTSRYGFVGSGFKAVGFERLVWGGGRHIAMLSFCSKMSSWFSTFNYLIQA
jgi:hypothetical protein